MSGLKPVPKRGLAQSQALPREVDTLVARSAPHQQRQSQPNDLVGREAELAAVRRLLKRPGVRLVTLVGPPGVGKTRLALQVVRDVASQFHGGSWSVSLESVDDPTWVAAVIGQAVGCWGAAEEPLGATKLSTFFNARNAGNALLVIDNFEHVLAAAPMLSEILSLSPRLKLLVTSRSPLRVRWEHEFPVSPLATPASMSETADLKAILDYPSVSLFIERARAVRPDLVLDDDAISAIGEICTRLDGLPLAIELAAARSKVLSPRALLTWLDNAVNESPLRLLGAGAADGPARHRTLVDAIHWSYRLLTPLEQRVFRRLAVFAGGCTFDAAAAVCNTDAEELAHFTPSALLDVISSLVDKSLVRTADSDTEPRITVLATIRAFGLTALAEGGELHTTRRAHARYYLTLAREADRAFHSPAVDTWIRRLDTERDNLRSALAWSCSDEPSMPMALEIAASLWEFWALLGHLREGRYWLERAFAVTEGMRPDQLSPSVHATALHGVGVLARLQGDHQAAMSYLAQSAELAQELGDDSRRAYAMLHMALILQTQRNAKARSLTEESVRLFGKGGDRLGLAFALTVRGSAAVAEHNLDSARTALLESLAIFQAAQDWWGVGLALRSLGALAYQMGNIDEARLRLEESIKLLRQAGAKWSLSGALRLLADIARQRGAVDQAITLEEESAELCRQLGVDATVPSWFPGLARQLSATEEHREGLPSPSADATAVRVVSGSLLDATWRPPAGALTAREIEILRLVAAGKSNPEIAQTLCISLNTVARHVSHILAKTGTHNRVGAALAAKQLGFIS